MGLGLSHYVPLVAYLGFWVMCVLSLTGRPLYGLYYLMPFLPYRSLREYFDQWPLGNNMLTILVLCVIIGALLKGKKLPQSKLYLTWLLFGLYLYVSLWLGAAISNAPLPVWLSDLNFVTWKDYMLMPLIFAAAGLVIEDRKAVRTVIIITGITLFLVDKSALAESLSHSWAKYDDNKRTGGPLVWGSNQLAAYLAQFTMFFWGVVTFVKRKSFKLVGYGLIGLSAITTAYAFSRAAYLALIVSIFVLAVLKNRKLLIVLGLFLVMWQSIVPAAVTNRVTMTTDSNGQLEASAQERVDLWTQSRDMFVSSPIVGRGYATFQFGQHTDNLVDTHNWFVKVLVETGLIGGVFAFAIIAQMLLAGYQLFRKAEDPLYKGLGFGFFLATISCSIGNFFGDRWTYIEIMGLMWVVAGATLRARELTKCMPAAKREEVEEEEEEALPLPASPLPPHLGWKY